MIFSSRDIERMIDKILFVYVSTQLQKEYIKQNTNMYGRVDMAVKQANEIMREVNIR